MAGSAFPSASRLRALVFAQRLWQRFDEDRCLAAAASLSYTSLLALVPLVAIAVAVLAAFPVFDALRDELKAFVFANLLPSAVDNAQEYLDAFVGKARGLTAVGVVGLAVTSLLLFFTIESALNMIFRVSRPRAVLPRLLVFWAILSLGPLLIGASFSIATYAMALTRSLGGDAVSGPLELAGRIAPTLLVIVAFTFFYVVIPNRPVRFGHALVGGAVAGLLFSALRWGLTLYVTWFPAYQTLYGALATIPIFLFWMYLSWAVILAGAVLTAELPHWGEPAHASPLRQEPAARLALALTLLAAMYGSMRSGRGAKRRTLLGVVDLPDTTVDVMLARLRRTHFAARTDTGRWVATRDPETTTLYDLYRALGLDLRVEDLADLEGASIGEQRLRELIRVECERQKNLMAIDLRTLLLGDEAPAVEAAPLTLRRPP